MQTQPIFKAKMAFAPDETIALAEATCGAAAHAGVLSDSMRANIAKHLYESMTRDAFDSKNIVQRATEHLINPVVIG